ncbi:MAG: methyltransferase domain-containing protein [Clostridiaceae bacterium]|nr:methyltransferase domain-containing protein [Clostridiaceae bacterium]
MKKIVIKNTPAKTVKTVAPYDALAAYYDAFTDDVPYRKWADWMEAAFRRAGIAPTIVLDLCCGTGTLTGMLAKRGYDMIGADASTAMLSRAYQNAPGVLFLQQRAESLDLYGTVDACVCSLDAINYLTDEAVLREAFRRVALFMNPGGVFLFDALTPAQLALVADSGYIREGLDATCVHSETCEGDFIRHRVDLFIRAADGRYDRVTETHRERVYAPDELRASLTDAGFSRVEVFAPATFEPLAPDAPRAAYIAYK